MTELLIKLFIKEGDENSRHKYGVMAGVVGIICNLILTVFKVITGIVTGAVSIATDAINNFSDAISSIVTLIGFKISGKPADREHPYGHGRVEYLTGFIVSAAVIAVALTLLKESVLNIINPKELDVSIATIIILVASILLKLWMSMFYAKIAGRISSEAMMAAATDSRSDCITTGVALISIICMLIFKINIDGYAGAVVSLFVIRSGFQSAKDTIEPLLGKAPDPELTSKLTAEAKAHSEILGVHDIRVHDYGHDRVIASMHVELPYNMTLTDAHELIDRIEHSIMSQKLVNEVSIHIDPVNVDDEEMLLIKRELCAYLAHIDGRLSIHDFRLVREDGRYRLIFEVLASYDLDMTDEEITELLRTKAESLKPGCELSIVIDRE